MGGNLRVWLMGVGYDPQVRGMGGGLQPSGERYRRWVAWREDELKAVQYQG